MKALPSISISVAKRVTSLGFGLGAGVRRNVKQMRKRLPAFKNRRSRFKLLRRSGTKTPRVIRIGGLAALTFGQRASGIPGSMLLLQRRAVAACTAISTCRANLDITLLLADECSIGTADLAFEARVGVDHGWSLAVWEHWAPCFMLSHLVPKAQERFSEEKSKWKLVYGPAVAGLVLPLRRIRWCIVFAFGVISDDGIRVGCAISSPSYVFSLVTSAVSRWRCRRIEEKIPALDSGGLGLGAAWRPISVALRARDSKELCPEQKGALRSLLAGRQWIQQRLHGAGLVESNVCKLCKDMPEGNQGGILLHRNCFCLALSEFREK